MADYQLAIIEEAYSAGNDLSQFASVSAWNEARSVLLNQYSFNFNVEPLIANPNRYANEAWYQALQLTRFPVILIVHTSTKTLMAHLGPGQISASRIVHAFQEINTLSYDTSSGRFRYPDGSLLGDGGIFNSTTNTNGAGGGLIPSSWSGVGASTWLPFVAMAAGGIQAARSKGAQQLLWGGLGAWGALSYFNQPSAEVAGIGVVKSTDVLPIKPGSRVDQYWEKHIRFDFKHFGKRRTYFETQRILPSVTEITERFNLHSIEFGNWVTQQERLTALIGIGQSLSDLAKVLNVPQNKIGLDGTLAIAFGARGRGGGASATYSPLYRVINLTKTQGANSLAHEYGHAIDHLAATGLSNAYLASDVPQMRDGQKGTYYSRTIDHLLYDEKGPTKFNVRLNKYSDYYNRRHEIWARTFETWVQSELEKKKMVNTFLAKSRPGYAPGVYPQRTELKRVDGFIRKAIRATFDKAK